MPDAKSMDVFWKIGVENGQFTARMQESQWLDTKWIDSYPQWVK